MMRHHFNVKHPYMNNRFDVCLSIIAKTIPILVPTHQQRLTNDDATIHGNNDQRMHVLWTVAIYTRCETNHQDLNEAV